MFQCLFEKKATAMLEYSALLVLVLAGFIPMHIYISRGFAGKWKDVGDSFGSGRQFDLNFTEECACSEVFNRWYEVTCFDQRYDPSQVDLLFNTCYEHCGPQKVSDGGRTGPCASAVAGHVVDLPVIGRVAVPNDITECARCCAIESKNEHGRERAVACPGINCNRPHDSSFGPVQFDCI